MAICLLFFFKLFLLPFSKQSSIVRKRNGHIATWSLGSLVEMHRIMNRIDRLDAVRLFVLAAESRDSGRRRLRIVAGH